jgi:hypothetical protein
VLLPITPFPALQLYVATLCNHSASASTNHSPEQAITNSLRFQCKWLAHGFHSSTTSFSPEAVLPSTSNDVPSQRHTLYCLAFRLPRSHPSSSRRGIRWESTRGFEERLPTYRKRLSPTHSGLSLAFGSSDIILMLETTRNDSLYNVLT